MTPARLAVEGYHDEAWLTLFVVVDYRQNKVSDGQALNKLRAYFVKLIDHVFPILLNLAYKMNAKSTFSS